MTSRTDGYPVLFITHKVNSHGTNRRGWHPWAEVNSNADKKEQNDPSEPQSALCKLDSISICFVVTPSWVLDFPFHSLRVFISLSIVAGKDLGI